MRCSRAVAWLLLVASCGGGSGGGQDRTAPAAVTDLEAVAGTVPGTVDLTWTASGDDRHEGRAWTYRVVTSPAPIDEGNFESLPEFPQSWTPAGAGSVETYTIGGLAQEQALYIALKVADEVPNVSGISNVVMVDVPDTVLAMGWLGGGVDGWQMGDSPPAGTDDRSLDRPFHVFADAVGDILVPDYINHRISRWSSGATALGWLGGSTDGWHFGDAPSSGTDGRSFNLPRDVLVDAWGDILVLDRNNNRVSKWIAAGSFVGWIGGGSDGWKTGDAPAAGTNHRSFSSPSGFAIGPDGGIYVADQFNNRVSKWAPDGNAVGWIGGGADGWKTGAAPGGGSDLRSFDFPNSVFLDDAGNLYVGDMFNNRVVKWAPDGSAVGWLGGGADGWQVGDAPPAGDDLCSFNHPFGVWISADGSIYAADHVNRRVVKWRGDGTAVGWLGGGADGWQTGAAPPSGTDYRSFSRPRDVFGDADGNLYVADSDRICRWRE